MNYNPAAFSGERFEEIQARLKQGMQKLVENTKKRILFGRKSWNDFANFIHRFTLWKFGTFERRKLPENTEVRVVEYKISNL